MVACRTGLTLGTGAGVPPSGFLFFPFPGSALSRPEGARARGHPEPIVIHLKWRAPGPGEMEIRPHPAGGGQATSERPSKIG